MWFIINSYNPTKKKKKMPSYLFLPLGAAKYTLVNCWNIVKELNYSLFVKNKSFKNLDWNSWTKPSVCECVFRLHSLKRTVPLVNGTDWSPQGSSLEFKGHGVVRCLLCLQTMQAAEGGAGKGASSSTASMSTI